MVYNDRKVVPLAKGESVVTNSAYILFYQVMLDARPSV
jgi:ubiquitin C-terminal hydrolase